jgi:hypothetical protein
MSGGRGLSSTLGVAAFPDGIVYRVGDPAPAIYMARLAISQTFNLGGGRGINEEGEGAGYVATAPPRLDTNSTARTRLVGCRRW